MKHEDSRLGDLVHHESVAVRAIAKTLLKELEEYDELLRKRKLRERDKELEIAGRH